MEVAFVSDIWQLRIQKSKMCNDFLTTPWSPVFAGIALGLICAIKSTQHVLKSIGKGIYNNFTVSLYMECRHQISNTLLYHLSTSIFVVEDGSSSGLALSVHNLLIWVRCLLLIIRSPEIRGVRLDFLLFDGSLEWGSRRYGRSRSWNEAWIVVIDWWIWIIPPVFISAKFSGCFLFRDFHVIEDVFITHWGMDEFRWVFIGKIEFVIMKLVVPKAQRVGGLRSPHLNGHRSACCF